MRSSRVPALLRMAAPLLGLTAFACAPASQLRTLTPPAPTSVAPEASPRELFQQAVVAFDAGRLEEARALFGRAKAKAPKHLVIEYNLGIIAERQGRLTEALQAYRAAADLDPRHKPTILNLGRVLRNSDRVEEAIALYEAACREPGAEFDLELNTNLTVAYRLAKRFDKAEATTRKVLERTADNADAYKNLALIYYDQGLYRLAELMSAQARKLDETDPGVSNNLGLIYLKTDEPQLALAQFQRAVALNKNFVPSLFNLGALAIRYRDYPSAERALARASELEPQSYDTALAYGWALDGQKGKDPKKGLAAGAAFERALSLKPNQPEAVCAAGWSYAADRLGWARARRYLEQCRALPHTTAQEQQAIDLKLKTIAALEAPSQAEKERPRPAPSQQGAKLLERVSSEAAAEVEGTPGAPSTPSQGGAVTNQPSTP